MDILVYNVFPYLKPIELQNFKLVSKGCIPIIERRTEEYLNFEMWMEEGRINIRVEKGLEEIKFSTAYIHYLFSCNSFGVVKDEINYGVLVRLCEVTIFKGNSLKINIPRYLLFIKFGTFSVIWFSMAGRYNKVVDTL